MVQSCVGQVYIIYSSDNFVLETRNNADIIYLDRLVTTASKCE